MKRRFLWALGAALLAALLSGCEFKLFKSVEDLYTRPQLPQDYQELEKTIDMVKTALAADDVTPLSGSNPSTVQLLDLDSDGVEEAAAAFFRASVTDDPKPLKIYIFRKSGDGTYNIAYRLEGEGNNIDSIYYEDLDGDGRKEVIVGWQLTTRANVLSVYALSNPEPSELIHATYNESYSLTDLNGDGCKEVLVIQRDDTGESTSRVEYYTYQGGVLTMTSSAPLSANVTDVAKARSGILVDGTPALYVTSECEGGQVTDILICGRDGQLSNVTLNPDSRVSSDTLRDYTEVSATDINRDGVLEIPVALALPKVSADSSTTYRIIYWRHFDREGNASVACITYHSFDGVDEGWYLILPNEWDGQIMVERDDQQYALGERAVVFYHRNGENGTPERFLTVYRLTGSSRRTRAELGGRVVLLPDNGTVIYAAEFAENGWDCGLDMNQLRERFNRYVKEWSTT